MRAKGSLIGVTVVGEPFLELQAIKIHSIKWSSRILLNQPTLLILAEQGF